MTKPSYEELERQLAELKRGLRNNNTDFELAFLDHYLDHFKTLTRRADTAESELARVRGLLQRWEKYHQQLREALASGYQATLLALLDETDPPSLYPNFPQSSSLVSQGAESADIGKLDTADESGVEMGKVNMVDEHLPYYVDEPDAFSDGRYRIRKKVAVPFEWNIFAYFNDKRMAVEYVAWLNRGSAETGREKAGND